MTALLGAGQAALDLGDIQAANGFFARANMVNPQLGKAKLGLAIVQIALKQATSAAENFDAAQALGEQPTGHLAERGLAYDLTGQQDKAQRDYMAALRANSADETARLRYAVSLGISGKIGDADRQLEQALATGDREAWRMRAFIYAMNGRMTDARKVTQSVMPKGLADALDPYMQRLPLLTPPQKAAAAYYGEFPTNVLKLAAPDPVREREVQVASAATDGGKRSRRPTSAERRAARGAEAQAREAEKAAAARAAAPRPAPAPPVATTLAAAAPIRAATPPPIRREAPPPATIAPPAASPVRQEAPRSSPPPQSASAPQRNYEAPTTVALAQSNVERAEPPPGQIQGPADPGTELVSAAPPRTSTPPAANPMPAPVRTEPAPGFSAAAQPIAAPPRSLADALSALSIPEQERQSAAVSADLRAVARIQEQRRKAAEAAAAKAKAEAEAKAKAEAAKKAEAERKAKLAANPSRSWVQIATGKDVDALAFDLRRLRRSYADAIGDQAGWTAEWGATRRLLIGPFKKVEDAKAVVAQITKSGGDAFLWQSDAGEEVAKIGGK
ncbi:tetratricopeptide repeat protein [Sphingobium nicotianae]|uniref:tetratricopeptide repeat protein n=1 Tax=Sphingobium nicotianae TaxID=2782607 RepID=UPI001BE4854B|nr:SPOR domain-containing protein [Sphingobium nicotianae]